MTLNVELFKKIHKQITENPGSHDQGAWEDEHPCGTIRCAAGWAIHLTTGGPVYAAGGYLSSATRELARQTLPAGVTLSIPRMARSLLGLTANQAAALFYTSNDEAAELIALAAAGDVEAFTAGIDELNG